VVVAVVLAALAAVEDSVVEEPADHGNSSIIRYEICDNTVDKHKLPFGEEQSDAQGHLYARVLFDLIH
jgi:hypothetical protein